MAEKLKGEGRVERWSRHLRNLHILGATALFGVGVLFPPAMAAAGELAGFAAVEAGGFGLIHNTSKRRRERGK